MIQGVRQFKMINGNGAEFDLTRPGYLLWQPEGLGWGVTPEVTPVGTTYIVTGNELERPRPSGSIVFSSYKNYQEFLSFLQVGGLVLCYRPINTWYYLSCTVIIGKSEIEPETNKLICPVNFEGTSQWYENLVSMALTFEQPEEAKAYGETGYSYEYVYGDAVTGSVMIQNGSLSSYFKLTIMGPVSNPVYVLYQDGKQLHKGIINVTVVAGRKLVIDTNPAAMEIAEYSTNNQYIAGRYGNSDFETERFFALPPGISQLQVNDDNGPVTSAFVEVRKRV